MSRPVILCADSTCDLGEQLSERFNVRTYPLHVVLEEKTYRDGIDLSTDDIVRTYKEKKVLPHTAAVNVQEYTELFGAFVQGGCDVVHISLGYGLSSSYQNACLAADEFEGHVFVVNSGSLSTGSGHLVLEAASRIEQGLPAEQIVNELNELRDKVSASFVLDTLEFLYKGGRCSALSMMGANLLKLKPCIRVNTEDGTMSPAKKYRGSLDKCLEEYVRDELEGRDDIRLDKIFVTHSPLDNPATVEKVVALIKELHPFENVYVTPAGCAVGAHCGPNCLGVLYMTK